MHDWLACWVKMDRINLITSLFNPLECVFTIILIVFIFTVFWLTAIPPATRCSVSTPCAWFHWSLARQPHLTKQKEKRVLSCMMLAAGKLMASGRSPLLFFLPKSPVSAATELTVSALSCQTNPAPPCYQTRATSSRLTILAYKAVRSDKMCRRAKATGI